MIDNSTHRDGVALGVGNAHIHRQSVVVQPTTVGGVRHIVLLTGALHHIPHLLLDVHGACSIEDDQVVIGMRLLQQLLRLQQGSDGVRMQVGLTQILVEQPAHEVVVTCIHQVHQDIAILLRYIDIAQRIQILGRWAKGLNRCCH